jgi:hypothetical protein
MTTQSAEEAAKARFQRFIDDAIEKNPIEALLVRRLIKDMAAAGTPIVSTYDRVEYVKVDGEREILEQVFNLDEVFLLTKRKSYVFLVMGNEQDIFADYTMDLEPIMAPIQRYAEKFDR